ncbi:hypothetical protein PT974_02014 [Cladobotryum mycophilum]|uniref:Heterokaryon incompatibility domain-containing protein n=1 Tax=Cladobotryum mycophilum TaxID=491253 RepID=A0ABR0SY18_9HYPO
MTQGQLCLKCQEFFSATDLFPILENPHIVFNYVDFNTLAGRYATQGFRDSPAWNLHHSLSELATNNQNCPCCAIIWNSIDKTSDGVFHLNLQQTHIVLTVDFRPGWGTFRLGLVFFASTAVSIEYLYCQDLTSFSVFDLEGRDQAKTWLRAVDKETTISRIRGWYRAGISTNDQDCENIKFPEFLIDITHKRKPRSCIVIEAGKVAKQEPRLTYVTICHHYGLDKKKSLFSSRPGSQRFQKPVLWKTMPVWLQQAFSVLCQLGIHLVWIDDPYLSHDGTEGRHKELQSLFDIYHQSAFTLAVTGNKTSKSPFSDFQASGIPCIIEPQWMDMNKCRLMPSTYRLVDNMSYCRQVKRLPLLNEGWQWTQMFASQRILSWADDQFWWYSNTDGGRWAANQSCTGYD